MTHGGKSNLFFRLGRIDLGNLVKVLTNLGVSEDVVVVLVYFRKEGGSCLLDTIQRPAQFGARDSSLDIDVQIDGQVVDLLTTIKSDRGQNQDLFITVTTAPLVGVAAE